MLSNAQKDFQRFLNDLADLLDITPSQFEKAKDRYTAVSLWLAKPDSPLRQYNPEIYPQGSFRLGTVIKPISGEDEFDIDLVCNLDISKSHFSQKELKNMVGDRLKSNADYKRMLDDEGRRCWTLEYQETPKFHLDVLPSTKDQFQWLLEHKVTLDYAKTAICITDKDCDEYQIISDNWLKSNPIGYASWFKDQMKVQFLEQRKLLAENRKVSIEEVKDEEIKTPLQRAIQILKRHRDIMFGDDEDRPISIIITTLAARAYSEEDNIYFALRNILERMPDHIVKINGKSVVANPVNPIENFADKWETYPQREDNFIAWMRKAKEDIFELVDKFGFENSIENLGEVLGKRSVNEALNKSGLQVLNEGKTSFLNTRTNLPFASHKENPNWPMSLTKDVSIAARYEDGKNWHTITSSTIIPKDKKLYFRANTNVPKPYSVYWQVVNTGEEASRSGDLRGKIFPAQSAGAGGLKHTESTKYSGTHWIVCYIVKDGRCIARSNEIVIKIP